MSSLSVIVPLYNQEKYICECIESIQKQTYRDIEIIIVDDGSTDQSGEICDKIAENDNRILVIHQKNMGLAGARYTGIMHASSKFITFVDADDFITSNAYDDAFYYLDKGYDQVFYEISRYYDNGRIKREYHLVEPGIYDRARIINEIYPKLIWDFQRGVPGLECSQCVRIVRKELLLEAYEELQGRSYYYGEDIVITYPLLCHIQKLAVISKSYYMHRQRKDGEAPEYISSDGYFDEILRMYAYLRMKMKQYDNYDFSKQIDYMYMYSVNLKKWSYHDLHYNRDFLFPFNRVEAGKRVILYGAGLVGTTYYNQITKLNYCSGILWVDKDAINLNNQLVHSVSDLDNECCHLYDYIVIAIENKKVTEEVREYLLNKGYLSEKIVC